MTPVVFRARVAALPKVVRDAVWITSGSVLGAVGTMVGLRLVTEVAPAELYGAFVIANGILALCTGVALQPVAQAALRFYPDLERAGASDVLRDVMAAESWRRLFWLSGVVAIAAVLDSMVLQGLSLAAWFVMPMTLLIEPLRTIEIVLRNASGDQGGYALLGAVDATARPIGAAAFAWLVGPSIEQLLLGQLVGGACVLVFFVTRLPRPLNVDRLAWQRDLRAYGAPLAWTPVLGWVISLADRYIIAWLLGPAAAGIYAAAYGLVSRPMLMLGGIADATFRQRLYSAVAETDRRRTARVQLVWLVVNVGLGLAVGFALVRLGEWIVAIVLAEPFRAPVLPLLLPIALGHVAILAYQAVVRRLYAAGCTGQVLLIDGVAGVLAVLGIMFGALVGGLAGAAWAMPAYTCLQLVLALAFAGRMR